MEHNLYKDGDADIPYSIQDTNREVLCKTCGGGECSLSTNCVGRVLTAKEEDLICTGELDF